MILVKRFIPMFCFLVLTNLQIYTEDVFYLLPKGSYIFSEEDVFSFDSVPREEQGEMISDGKPCIYIQLFRVWNRVFNRVGLRIRTIHFIELLLAS